MHIQIHDVGHGACAVITFPTGHRLMIDCGTRQEPAWSPSIAYLGESIDLLVLSNLDEDHVADLPDVRTFLAPRAIFSNPTVDARSLLNMKPDGMRRGVRAAYDLLNNVGQLNGTISHGLGGAEAWAYYNFHPRFSDTNNLSVAVYVRYGSFAILFAGDLETAGWRGLLKLPQFRAHLATIQVLVASHHGRENGCCDEAFQIAKPEVVIFSDDRMQYESQKTDAWYRQRVSGIPDLRKRVTLATGEPKRHVLTTRRDGSLSINVAPQNYLITPSRQTPPLSPLALTLLGLGRTA